MCARGHVGAAACAGLLLALALAASGAAAETVLRAPLQVLAATPLGDALRAVDQLGTCGNGVRAELYLADPAVVVALALRGERADVVAAAGDAGPLVAAGLVEAPRPLATRDGVAYWIAPLRGAREPAIARAFVDAVVAPKGRAILAREGFAPVAPPPP